MNWTVETVSAVDAEIEALPVGLRARLIRLLEVVGNAGLETLRAPHVRHLDGKLWGCGCGPKEASRGVST